MSAIQSSLFLEMHHSLFIHSPVDSHLGFSSLEVTILNTVMSVHV